jgi:hypothetical protein
MVDAQAHGVGAEQELLLGGVVATAPLRTTDTLITADAGYHSEANLRALADASAFLDDLEGDATAHGQHIREGSWPLSRRKPITLSTAVWRPMSSNRHSTSGDRRGGSLWRGCSTADRQRLAP